MPEITTITSESLQAEVRRLLPSQRGFGTDLEAQNVIVPIVDLTPTAEGSSLRADLQTASSFTGITVQQRVGAASGGTSVITTPGFYRYIVSMNVASSGTADTFNTRLELQNGLTFKPLHKIMNVVSSTGGFDFESFEGVVFLAPGDILRIGNKGTGTAIHCTAWQVADVNGNLINPPDFSFE